MSLYCSVTVAGENEGSVAVSIAESAVSAFIPAEDRVGLAAEQDQWPPPSMDEAVRQLVDRRVRAAEEKVPSKATLDKEVRDTKEDDGLDPEPKAMAEKEEDIKDVEKAEDKIEDKQDDDDAYERQVRGSGEPHRSLAVVM
jgi:hypothetical protein